MADSDSDCSTLTDLSSELSSPPSSPIPPPSHLPYPTPASSQAQSTYSSSGEESRKRRWKDAEHPPVKKRRTADPKERRTEYLNLRAQSRQSSADQSAQLAILLKALRKKKKIVVIAGAGISTSAGVPDFRSSNGLFNTLRNDHKLKASGKQLFDASVYQTDASTSSFHEMVRLLSKVVSGAKPTAFHHMLATLAHEGRLLRLYTQNVDGLDTDLEPLKSEIPLPKKGPWPRTIQLHGSLKRMVCAKCGDLREFDPELFDGPNPPSCSSCADLDKVRTEEAGKRSHGIGKLRPRMVLYHEQNPDDEAIGSVSSADLRARPDAIIVVGTSLEIPGVRRIVREMCGVIRSRKDGKCIWINRGPPPSGPKFEDIWDLVVAGDCDQVAELADMRKWYEEPREGVPVTESDAERAKAKDSGLKILVKSPHKEKCRSGNLPTPLPSPKLKADLKTGLKLNFKLLAQKKQSLKLSQKAQSSQPSSKPKQSKVSKSKPKPKPKPSRAAGMATINATFKVSKPVKSGRKSKLAEDSRPFDLIPPHSVRNNSNGSPLQEISEVRLDQNDVKVNETTTPQPGRLKRMSEERISPTGPLPRRFEHILN